MQVILLKDVPKVGKKGELCQVSDGYGRNFLIARGFAVTASEGRLKAIDREKAQRQASADREKAAAQELAAKLEEVPIVVKANSGEGGRLFGAITSSLIAESLKAQRGETIDKRVIKMDTPIKALGEHKVVLKIHPEVKATITVKIVEG